MLKDFISSVLAILTICFCFFYKQKVFHDIQSALHVWSDMGIPTSDDFMPENTMLLLYNIIDLLSIKVRSSFNLIWCCWFNMNEEILF